MKLALTALLLACALLGTVLLWPAPATQTITILVPAPPTTRPTLRQAPRPVVVQVVERPTARPTRTAVAAPTVLPWTPTPGTTCYWYSEEFNRDVQTAGACPAGEE